MIYTTQIKNIWHTLYDPQTEVTEVVERFFHQNYQQCINGVNMNRTEYIEHVRKQKKNMTINVVDYKHVLEKDNELFAIYCPKGKNIHNAPIEAEVIAYFLFENQQILRIHSMVRLITGDLADVDMQHNI
jgi:hypothetical protein